MGRGPEVGSFRPETEDAARQRFAACREHLVKHARRLIPSPIKVEIAASDLVLEAFLDAQRHAEVMPSEDSDRFRAWLSRILVPNLAERKRLAIRRRLTIQDPCGSGEAWEGVADRRPTPRMLASGKERSDRLVRAIGLLPELAQQVIRWRYWEHLEFAEIGRWLGGRSDEAARKLHVRACKKLDAILGDGFP